MRFAVGIWRDGALDMGGVIVGLSASVRCGLPFPLPFLFSSSYSSWLVCSWLSLKQTAPFSFLTDLIREFWGVTCKIYSQNSFLLRWGLHLEGMAGRRREKWYLGDVAAAAGAVAVVLLGLVRPLVALRPLRGMYSAGPWGDEVHIFFNRFPFSWVCSSECKRPFLNYPNLDD